MQGQRATFRSFALSPRQRDNDRFVMGSWLTAMWLILQADKGLSSLRLAEALGVSQPTAWRTGHAVRLMLRQERPLVGIIEADVSYVGGASRNDADRPRLGRGRKGQPRTEKTPVFGIVERPLDLTPGAPGWRGASACGRGPVEQRRRAGA